MTIDGVRDYIFAHHMAAAQQIAPLQRERSFVCHPFPVVSDPAFRQMRAIVRDTGRDVVLFLYDLAGLYPQCEEVWLLLPAIDPHAVARGEDLILLTGCRLWAPVGAGPVMIVPPKESNCHFAVVPDGVRLERRHGSPAAELSAGLRRARQRIANAVRAEGEVANGAARPLVSAA